MKRSLLMLPLLVCIGSPPAAGSELRLPSLPECGAAEETRHSAVLLVLDRTTRLSAVARQRWSKGVLQILQTSDLVGSLAVLEIRESANELRILGNGCLSSFDPSTVAARPTFYEHPWDWFSSFWNGSIDAEAEMGKRQRSRGARVTYAKELSALGDEDDETKVDSEIPQAVLSAIASYCANLSRCDVFLYSDLLDTRTKNEIRGVSRDRASQLGRSRAAALLQEFHPQLARVAISVHVWSFGRDDSAAKRSISEELRTRLRAFWDAYFTEIIKAGRGGTLSISDILTLEGASIKPTPETGKGSSPP